MPRQTTQKKSRSRPEKSGSKHVEKTLGRESPAKGRSTGTTARGKGDQKSPAGVHEHRVAKVVELVCSSTKGYQDAIENGVKDAAKTIHDIHGCEVRNISCTVQDGKIIQYTVDLKLAFGVEGTPRP